MLRLERGAKPTRKSRRKRLISLNPDSEMAPGQGEPFRPGQPFTDAASRLMAHLKIRIPTRQCVRGSSLAGAGKRRTGTGTGIRL
jgi:hypothetical protein